MLDHPHVLKLYGAVLDHDNICIVTELVPGGSLFDLIHTKPQLRPEAVIVIGSVLPPLSRIPRCSYDATDAAIDTPPRVPR